MFNKCFYLCMFKASFSSHGCFTILLAPSVVQLRVAIGILDLGEVGAELETGLFRLILHEVASILVVADNGSSTSTILRICHVVVFLPVGQVPQ